MGVGATKVEHVCKEGLSMRLTFKYVIDLIYLQKLECTSGAPALLHQTCDLTCSIWKFG